MFDAFRSELVSASQRKQAETFLNYNLDFQAALVSGWVGTALADLTAQKLASGPRPARGTDGAVVSEFAVVPKPGMKKSFSLGSWGEIGVEVG